jgi:hypothetical protein
MDKEVKEKILDLFKEKGLGAIYYLKLMGVKPGVKMYHLIKEVENLGYIPNNTISIIESRMPSFFSRGWGNGYVKIPKDHPLHGQSYVDSNEINSLDVPGGVTYSEKDDEDGGWVIGFDTAHSFNNPITHDRFYVMRKTTDLLLQLFT